MEEQRILPKLSATRTLRLCRSLCLRHLREIVCFHLRALPLSVCLLYVVGLLYHSIFRKNFFFILHWILLFSMYLYVKVLYVRGKLYHSKLLKSKKYLQTRNHFSNGGKKKELPNKINQVIVSCITQRTSLYL